PVVEDSIVEGGLAGGTNILDVDPMFAAGPDGPLYLSQVAAGQSVDSAAVDGGPVTASAAGLDALTTRTDSMPDAGAVDWGVHYAPFGALTVLRGVRPNALAPMATVGNLPWTDAGVVGDPGLPLLFYSVVPSGTPLHVVRADAVTDVEIRF